MRSIDTLDTILFAAETIVEILAFEDFVGRVWAEENDHEDRCGCDETRHALWALLDKGRDELFAARKRLDTLLGMLDEDERADARWLASILAETDPVAN